MNQKDRQKNEEKAKAIVASILIAAGIRKRPAAETKPRVP